jgi:hypothetical protein
MAETRQQPHHQPLQPLDHGRVNVLDPDALEYWCKELHCTEAQLKAAVTKVGTHVAAVREQLHHHK